MSELTKQERREIKLKEKREAKERMRQDFHKQESGKKIMVYGIIAAVLIIAVGFFLLLPKPEPVDYATGNLVFPLGNIHWHATPSITVCGESVSIPQPLPGQHLGSSLLHTHEDLKAHIEGSVSGPSQITIGAFMANVGMRFSENELADKKNGDLCPNGTAGKVSMIVNGTENTEFGNYVLRDGDIVDLKFS